MKAIILAAGEGSRLLPLTRDKPKCMVEYKGKSLLDRQVDSFRRCGIDDIVLVKGYMGDALNRNDLRYYCNAQYRDTNMVYTLFCAEREMDDDIVISYGDIAYSDNVLKKVVESNAPIAVAVDRRWRDLWEKRMENPLDDAETMVLSGDGRILRLGDKTNNIDDIQGQYIGLIKIQKEAWHEIIAYYHNMSKDCLYDGQIYEKMYMTSFIQAIINDLMPVHAAIINGGWVEIDRPSDLAVDFIE